MTSIPEPASSVTGFFQIPPKLPSAFDDDKSLRRLLSSFLPLSRQLEADHDLQKLAAHVISSTVLEDVEFADKNPPYLKHWDTWGNRVDKVITSDSWKRLRQLSVTEGMVAGPYEGEFGLTNRVIQLAKLNIFSGSACGVTFYTAFADGAAYLLRKHMSNHPDTETANILQSAYSKVVSRDPQKAWAAGLFMTERSGGSNIQGIETMAYPHVAELGSEPSLKDASGFDLGPWTIKGFKWFSSATESEMAFILAKTSKGISMFYAPLHRQEIDQYGDPVNRLNGIRIQRLKQKLGTLPKPTAELEFDGTRAWLIGQEGEGIKEVVNVLNIGRLHVGISALGMWARASSIVRSFSKVRRSGGRLLCEMPTYMRNLARAHVEYRAQLALILFVGMLLGTSENPESSRDLPIGYLIPDEIKDVDILLRLLTPVTKVLAVETSIQGLLQCMNNLGGVGFLENEEAPLNIARMYRDATMHVVLDGTPDALRLEMVRVLKGKLGPYAVDAMDRWIRNILQTASKASSEFGKLQEIWGNLKTDIETSATEDLLLVGGALMERLGHLVSGLLLAADAARDQDEVSVHCFKEWMTRFTLPSSLKGSLSAKDSLPIDQAVVFGR